MHNKLSFRRATSDDTEFARSVHHAAFRETIIKQFGSWDEAIEDGYFEEDWSQPGFQIVSWNGVECGYLLYTITSSQITLEELVILPNFQGKGIGTTIINDLKQKATAQSVPLQLQVLKENSARELYLRQGFEPTGETTTHIKMEWNN